MTVWTPRPPDPDEPACWSWLVPDVAELVDEHRRRYLDCGTEPFRDLTDMFRASRTVDAGIDGQRFNQFHAHRCAICGGFADVDDHCHATGQLRGRLCRSCNLIEGRAQKPRFVRYRRLHPAAILGYHETYTGLRWCRGWSMSGEEWIQGARPPTPWPIWNPDDPLPERPRRRSSAPAVRPATLAGEFKPWEKQGG